MANKVKAVKQVSKSAAKTKPDRKKRQAVSEEDQIVNLIDKLIEKKTKKAVTAEDYVNSALEIIDHTFFHVLFNLAYFGCDTQLVVDHVKETLYNFSADAEFPTFLKMLEENSEGCCDCCSDCCSDCSDCSESCCEESCCSGCGESCQTKVATDPTLN